ncbi:family 90 glycosyltransferase [Melampsora larici-populina 98AG31]|uniref:Family 90 glycosyltransferase n=1 Tax=Melampsora larici-populina (strain 98AG31 / pathotype 3-4-7) TaxID=747676 RepID=F4RYI0_MELLP|nr:family 90 glycosyltransferase [Melampsora larici-populina 98AG31]EGG02574.1 family 90 glycosyltransferase [Melampsora larici-populina 98AG31]
MNSLKQQEEDYFLNESNLLPSIEISQPTILNRRLPYVDQPSTPNLELQTLYPSPPTTGGGCGNSPDHHHRMQISIPTHSFIQSTAFDTPSPSKPTIRNCNVYLMSLLLSFGLGILLTYSLNPFINSSISSLSSPSALLPNWIKPSNHEYIQTVSSTPTPNSTNQTYSILDQDYVYLPNNYESINYNTSNYPILNLIKLAQEAWQSKLDSQSKTFQQAVTEYAKRYKRLPPKGFKDWFEWCLKNKVVLIDEFDRIHQVIEPFWALPPHVIRNRSEIVGLDDAFTIMRVKDGKVTVTGKKKDAGRTKDQLNLLKKFIQFLPDVNITMSHHDGPSVFMDYQTKQKHINYAREGKVIPEEEVDLVEDNAALTGFLGACSPDSPMRMYSNGILKSFSPEFGSKGYIGLNHSATMNMCLHPEWQSLHGFTSWSGPRPGVLRPIFSFAQQPSFTSDLLISPLEQFEDVLINSKDFKPWAKKTESKRLMWKGTATGVWFDRLSQWRNSHRFRLHSLGQFNQTDLMGSIKVLNVSRASDTGKEEVIRVVNRKVRFNELVKRYLNVGFVGKLGQCSVEDGSCEKVGQEIEFGDYVDWEYQNNHKYVLDIDGNAWSGRFRRLLGSNSLVFKSTIWPEWYQDRIQAWFHYVPIKIDYSDLLDLMSFFTGDLDGKGGFDGLAEQIAGNGKAWVDDHFRFEDVQAYMWRTYLEYARVSSDDRLEMNYNN